jgi:hypothetical protein
LRHPVFTLDGIKEKKYDILFYVLCNQLYAFIFTDFLIFLNINSSKKKLKSKNFQLLGGGVTPPPGRASPDGVKVVLGIRTWLPLLDPVATSQSIV